MLNKLFSRQIKTLGRHFSTYQNALPLNYYQYQSTTQGVEKSMIFLHGLLGRAKNWRFIALSKEAMGEDILRLADEQKLEKFTLLGHSMGGKVAMEVAQIDGSRLDGLIVVDAPPSDLHKQSQLYTGTVQIVQKLSSIDIKSHTKKSILKVLQQYFPKNPGMASFLAQNIIYQSDGIHVDWVCNMQGFNKNIRKLMGYQISKQYQGELLLLIGQKSYRFDQNAYRKLFPHLEQKHICIVEGAGHWVHADKPKTTVAEISKFLERLDGQ